MVLLNWGIQGLLRTGRLEDQFLVRRVGSSDFEELTVTHLLENGLWISMAPNEKGRICCQYFLRLDMDLEQVLPMGVQGGLPRDGGRMGRCMLRMGRVYSELARAYIFARPFWLESAESASFSSCGATCGASCRVFPAWHEAPPAPPELPPHEAPIWDFRPDDPNWRNGTVGDGIRRGNSRFPIRRRSFRECQMLPYPRHWDQCDMCGRPSKSPRCGRCGMMIGFRCIKLRMTCICSEDKKQGPADVDGNHAGAEGFPISRSGRRPSAEPLMWVPPSGNSGDADVDEAVISSVGGPNNGCWFLA